MPIPLILGAIAAAVGGLGVAGHAVAKETNQEAERIIDNADDRYQEAEELLEMTRDKTISKLADYGEYKIMVNSSTIKDYIDATNKLSSKAQKKLIRSIDIKAYDLTENDLMTKETYVNLEKSSANSLNIVKTGVASIGTGALASMGVFNGVSMLATASTGTAISSLSGVVATNATMAWLGGGSLAAGGLGMAGGIAMLGGVALGPAILVSSIFAGVKSEENLEKAKLYGKEVDLKVAEIKRVEQFLETMQKRVNEAKTVMEKFDSSLKRKLPEYSNVVNKQILINNTSRIKLIIDSLLSKVIKSYKRKFVLNDNDKSIVMITEILVKRIYQLSDTPLLDDEGQISLAFNELINEETVKHVLKMTN